MYLKQPISFCLSMVIVTGLVACMPEASSNQFVYPGTDAYQPRGGTYVDSPANDSPGEDVSTPEAPSDDEMIDEPDLGTSPPGQNEPGGGDESESGNDEENTGDDDTSDEEEPLEPPDVEGPDAPQYGDHIPENLQGWNEYEMAMLEATNNYRESGHVCDEDGDFGDPVPYPPTHIYIPSPKLHEVAAAHSEDMVENEYHNHRGLDGSMPMHRCSRAGYGSTFVKENLGELRPSDALDHAVHVYTNIDPGHCGTVMSPQYRYIGIAVRKRPDDGWHGGRRVITYLVGPVLE